jgi:hypothetical protein
MSVKKIGGHLKSPFFLSVLRDGNYSVVKNLHHPAFLFFCKAEEMRVVIENS